MQPRWEVAGVLRQTDIEKLALTGHQKKTLRAIRDCRTAALGGHVDACDSCGNISISYNSCRNRHCPKCQGHKREEWMQRREADLLPCTYFHVVFTLPHELNPLALYNPALVYKTLFEAVWQTLDQFGKTAGVRLGMVSILHTWGQNLSLHPHLHCVVPGAGTNAAGQWQKLKHGKNFLFPVKALGKVFRAKYVALLRAAGIDGRTLYDSLFAKEWVVYAKRPFGGPAQVIEYLGRYTHKVAISNHRIGGVGIDGVSFRYKDYKDGGVTKTMQLTNEEFVRRFAQHILPHRFVRIRHYGILSAGWKRGKLQALQKSLRVVRKDVPVKTLLRKCPCCKTGTLITIVVFGQRGPPEQYLMANNTATVTA
jgi:hypothetical protein